MDILKLKQINVGSTKLKDKKIPEESDGPTCLELYEKAVNEIKDYLSNYTSEMVRYSAGDYPWVEVQSEEHRNYDHKYYTNIGGTEFAGYIRFVSFLSSEDMSEEMACAFLEARGHVKLEGRGTGGRFIEVEGMDYERHKKNQIWEIKSGSPYGGVKYLIPEDDPNVKRRKEARVFLGREREQTHMSWFIQFWHVGSKVRGYQTKGELVMTEIMNIVNDIMEKYDNMRR